MVQFAFHLNIQYWMPAAKLYVRPRTEPNGLDLLMVGPDINWTTKIELEETEEDEGLPDLI